MRTKLPVCPRCDCDEVLSLWREGNEITARCHECGWSTGAILLATGELVGDVVAAKVDEAKAKVDEAKAKVEGGE